MKFNMPSGQYLMNLAIGIAILSMAMRFVPDRYKAYFRI